MIDSSEIKKLQNWHKTLDGSPTLTTEARGISYSATEFVIIYLDILRANKTPVVWVLPRTNIFDNNARSLGDIVMLLMIQILELRPKPC